VVLNPVVFIVSNVYALFVAVCAFGGLYVRCDGKDTGSHLYPFGSRLFTLLARKSPLGPPRGPFVDKGTIGAIKAGYVTLLKADIDRFVAVTNVELLIESFGYQVY
jgi:hypothetical protein